MHDTALEIGQKFLKLYVQKKRSRILDVGSQNINGTLRDFAPAGVRYIGVDLTTGDGVDVVLENAYLLPFVDNHFDAVITSSCFEHAQMFWLTFLEMIRVVRRGGYVYINAPSNGVYHSYPYDNWRFYPDAGLALTEWALHQGVLVTLIESFIAPRNVDIWNDCVIVFRKGPAQVKTLPKKILADTIPGIANVRRHDSDRVVNLAAETQDMLLLRQANEKLRRSARQLARMGRKLRDAKTISKC